MSSQEIKSEIQKSLDNVPDHVLQEILSIIKSNRELTSSRMANLNKILIEDKGLLEKLAK